VTANRLATPYQTPDESPGFLLWQITNRWQSAQRTALKPFDLTHVQFVLLASLTWLDTRRPITQRQLADHAATDPMMTSQVLRVLEKRGLIKRSPHPDDKRARTLTATRTGRTLANQAIVAVETCDGAFFRPLHPHTADFVRSLRNLIRDSDLEQT